MSVSNKNNKVSNKDSFQSSVKKELNKIRKYLKLHGGDVKFIDADLKSGVVRVQLTGACAHCPMSTITLKHSIEAELKEKITEVKEVVADE